MGEPCAIGRLEPDGPWVGFQRADSGYRVVVGSGSLLRSRPAGTQILLAIAIAWFEEAFETPPQEFEASQADLADLVHDVVDAVHDPLVRGPLADATDAIDDGLPGDAVAIPLTAAWRVMTAEETDPVELVVEVAGQMLTG